MRSNGDRAKIHEIVHVWWPAFSILHLAIRYGIIPLIRFFFGYYTLYIDSYIEDTLCTPIEEENYATHSPRNQHNKVFA